ncbi:MAG: phosphoribosylpyrophosphate synthetase [Bacteroidia bacterium]
METLSQATNRLQKEGYNSEILPNEIATLHPNEWQIEHICRFEGCSNPSDNSILYALAKKDGARKSLIINAYGVYNDAAINKFIEKVESL